MGKKIMINKACYLAGATEIPGDKSISHRSVMFAALSSTPVCIKNFLYSQDCLSTVACMRTLGAKIEQENKDLWVTGNGLYGLQEPVNVLDAGNSGTTIRLMAGILGGQNFFSILTGDGSLRQRPMSRVIIPLAKMGCTIVGREQSKFAPLAILPRNEKIHGIEYAMPMASAQVKSAILLASMFADSRTVITEPYLSRDHTERMLETFGVNLERSGVTVSLDPVDELIAPEVIDVPGDISSAAFWLVAATIIPNARLLLKNVGINPTRTGIIDVLQKMGAKITLENKRWSGKEPVADVSVESAELRGISVEAEIIPRLVDEIPVLAVAALFAQGRTVIQGAEELRVKETDRLKAITLELSKMGAKIEEKKDGLIIEGPQTLQFASCDSHDDHRMAMALAVAGLAGNGVEIKDYDCVTISYPNFFETLNGFTH